MNSVELDILVMTDNDLNLVGGEQESTKIIINGCKEKFQIGVIQPGYINNPQFGVRYFDLTKQTRLKRLIKHPIAFTKYFLGLKKIINTSKPQIIHTQAQVSFFMVALLKKMHLISKDVYLIHTERGLYTKYNLFFKHIFFFFMSKLDMLVTTTEFNMKYWKEALEKRGFFLNYRIIENTAGKLFEGYDESFNNFDQEKMTIGFAGRYCSWKNWPLAVEISSKINDIIGDKINVKMAVGCLDEDAMRETKKMFRKLENTFGDRFDGKINISIEEMDKFYYDIDVFILTSNHNTESFGRTLVEAMSRKTVVLTTDAGGSVEVVGDRDNVYRIADEFVERVIRYVGDREAMNIEKERNLQRVKDVYSLENNLSKHKKMYDEIIK